MVLKFEVHDRVALVTLNRPDQMNAQNLEMRKALVDAWERIDNDPDIWLAVVTGAGKAFSAGHDLKEKLTPEQDADDPGTAGVYGGLMAIEKPTIAAINGFCLAQGAGIAFLCDIRVCAEHVEFGWPQVKRGIGSVSGPAILSRMVPQNIAFEYLFTGEFFTAKEALEFNMVNRVLPAERVLEDAMDIAAKIQKNAPLALRAIKRATLLTKNMAQAEAFEVGEAIVKNVNQTEDAVEGKAAFAEKRDPVWQGR